jgi:hypothetical protein
LLASVSVDDGSRVGEQEGRAHTLSNLGWKCREDLKAALPVRKLYGRASISAIHFSHTPNRFSIAILIPTLHSRPVLLVPPPLPNLICRYPYTTPKLPPSTLNPVAIPFTTTKHFTGTTANLPTLVFRRAWQCCPASAVGTMFGTGVPATAWLGQRDSARMVCCRRSTTSQWIIVPRLSS